MNESPSVRRPDADPPQRAPWPECPPGTAFFYSFTVWPVEKWGFQREVYSLFKFLTRRVEMEFTEGDFERFRSALNRDGFALREVERVPALDPQDVS